MRSRKYMSMQTDVYRVRDADGRLLYVGISVNFWMRSREHRTYAPWWSLASHGTLDAYRNRREAALVEARAIRDEAPLFNAAHYNLLAGLDEPSPEPIETLMLSWEHNDVWWSHAS